MLPQVGEVADQDKHVVDPEPDCQQRQGADRGRLEPQAHEEVEAEGGEQAEEDEEEAVHGGSEAAPPGPWQPAYCSFFQGVTARCIRSSSASVSAGVAIFFV